MTQVRKFDLIFEKYEGIYTVLEDTITKDSKQILDDILESGLRGRGGAGFPTALKWKAAMETEGKDKYVICNADEGEPGTFKDREILLKAPRKVFSGLAVCAKIIGAKKGYIYLRNEYKFMLHHLQSHLDIFHQQLQRIGFDFKAEIFLGSGAYICGEESALLNSMEGKRGEPRNKPPFPVQSGYLGMPTVVNNVETLAAVTIIFRKGAQFYKDLGTKDSHGTKLFSISGDTPKAGVYELELGMNLGEFVKEFGDGDTKAVQVGGASGVCVPRKDFDSTIIGFEGVPTGGSIMLFNSSRSMFNVLSNYLHFFKEESCGQCTPCRVGCQQLTKGLELIKSGQKGPEHLDTLLTLCHTMTIASKCGLGRSVGNSFGSIVNNFREEILF